MINILKGENIINLDLTKEKVDLISINCVNPEESVKALEYSSKNIKFNNVLLFTHESITHSFIDIIKIDRLSNIRLYNNFILSLNNFIESDFVLLIQDDGHVVNSNLWQKEFLNFDYIGAPWPASKNWLKRWDKYEETEAKTIKRNFKMNRVGNGGFSLRSKKFLEYSSQFSECGQFSEDIFLTVLNYEVAVKNNINFPDVELAYSFSAEIPLKGKELKKENKKSKIYDFTKHFGWHGKRFENSSKLMNLKK